MSIANILHFCLEDLHRTAVLEDAGYAVLECRTIPELVRALRSGALLELICISEAVEKPEEGSLAVSRAYSQAPIVLFRSSHKAYIQSKLAVEVPPLTEPRLWLRTVGDVLSGSRRLTPSPRELRAVMKGAANA